MAEEAEFENLKKEIRSILMPFKKGCDLFEFRKEYRLMLGRAIPYQKFGYQDDVDLLFDIPDVVWISEEGSSYNLTAVADETTQHIQKMVASQKADTKKKKFSKGSRFNKFLTSSTRYVPRSTPLNRPSYRTPSISHLSSHSRPSSIANTPSSVVSKPSSVSRPSSVAYNSTSAVSRPSSVAYNSTSAVSRLSSVAYNSTSAVSRPSSVAYNSTSAVSRPSSVATNHVPLLSNPSSFASKLSPAINSPPFASRPPSAVGNSSSNPSKAVTNRESIPSAGNPIGARKINNNNRRFRRDLPPRFRVTSSTTLLPPDVECRIVDVVRKYSTGLRMRDFFLAYQRRYDQQFSFENHGFGSLQECLQTIPDLSMQPLSNDDFTIYYNGGRATESGIKPHETGSTASAYNFEDLSQANEKSQYYQNNAVFKTSSPEEESRVQKSKVDDLDTFEEASSLGLTENMKKIFRKIISTHKHGICAKDFPKIYEEVTESQFDLHSLGFSDLAGLVDSLPDIFRRKRVAGSRKDWIIAPVGVCEEEEDLDAGNSSPKVGALLIDCCIQSIRKILQGFPEGIALNDFLHMYSINCNEPLYIVDLGFDCIENFLMSISSRVPLKIELVKGSKTVYLKDTEEVVDDPVATILEEDLPEAIPFDAASPDCRYKKLELPLDMGTSKFVPVYTSEIINPGHIFIQLHGENTSEALNELSDEIEHFYKSPHSAHYHLHDRYLKEGAMCASLWPKDKLWYRALIRSVVSQDTVQVFYVDYGTSDVVPRDLLRYLKEPFAKLPAQAVKASLAHVYPPNKLPNWPLESKKRMLQLCQDVRLMAKVVDIKDGVLSLILCDTESGDEDLFINDVLILEGLAEQELDKDEMPPKSQLPSCDPVQLMQAHSFYQLLNSLSLTMPAEKVAESMQTLSLMFPTNPFVPKPSGGSTSQLPFEAYQAAAAAFQSFPGAEACQLPTAAPAYQSSSGAAAACQLSSGAAAYQSTLGAAAYQLPSVAALGLDQQMWSSSGKASRESSVDESEIFQDDEDLFNEFLEKSYLVSKRYVKRIRTDDGYFFHILIVDGRPYVSSGDISLLIWSDKKPDHLLERLQSRDDIVFQSRSISEEFNEEMFDQFEKFYVKGIQKGGEMAYIIIYPLQSAIAILNAYGHPSVELRQQIKMEMESFDPNLPTWQELSEMEIPEAEEEVFRAVTDDDKLSRLCIYDLLAMKDGIRIKKNSFLRGLTSENHQPHLVERLEKLENLLQRVELRITEIRLICSTFAC